jgi:hypothetical protein
MRTALALTFTFVFATLAHPTDGPVPCLGNNICTGILHEDPSKVWLSNILGIKETKLVVVIKGPDKAKVLKVCIVGQYCKIFGDSATNCDIPKCMELSDIVAVEKNRDYSGLNASEALLTIRTRFGAVVVAKDDSDCCRGTARFRSDRIELGSPGNLAASLQGAFETAEGDVIVLSVPGARGMPDLYYVFLVNRIKMIDITPQDFGVNDDGVFKATQKGREIFFDLGWHDGKRKRAFYRAGVIYMGLNNSGATTLPKRDCAYVLNELARCEQITDCENVSDKIAMAVQRGLYALENKPVFKGDNFYRLCKSVCIGQNYNAAPAREVLCGY